MIVPVRQLGAKGVMADMDAFASEFNDFTMAVNVRFEDNQITRGPIFATISSLPNTATPQFVISYKTLNEDARFEYADTVGNVWSFSANSSVFGGIGDVTNVSAANNVDNLYSEPYTGTILNDVVFLNRSDREPWFKTKGNTQYELLSSSSDWNSTWRCKVFRSVGGVCVAANIIKNGVAYPTTVMTSDFFLFGTTPSWTPTPTNSATETTISELGEPIVDAFPFRDRLIVYSENETWLMEPRYDNLMFNYRRIFTNAGVISPNCVAEWNNQHFVFGPNDIWAHDGFTKMSLTDGRVRHFIFGSIVRDSAHLFFVVPNIPNHEIWFCYVSEDPYCAFPVDDNIGYKGCNRVAVFNFVSKTWTFYDLPYVTGMGVGSTVPETTWSETTPQTWDTIVGAWSSFSGNTRVSMLTVSHEVTGTPRGNVACAVRSFDVPYSTTINGVLDPVATPPAQLYNDTINLDQLFESVRQYKVVTTIYPQAVLLEGSEPLWFDFESSDYSSDPPPMYSGNEQSYDGGVNYKLDYRSAGRFLGYKMRYDSHFPFSLSGFDIEIQRTGNR